MGLTPRPPPTRWSTRAAGEPASADADGAEVAVADPVIVEAAATEAAAIGPGAQSPRSAPPRRGTSPLPPIRLSKILAQRGLSSRRGAEALLGAGRVRINGEVRREPGAQADPERDVITVDGRPLPPVAAHRYVLLHKPRGYVTSRRDPEGRPVVIDLLPAGAERLFPVGRLDFDAEGLLLLTNDGELGNRLLHPRYEIPRVYEVEVERRVRAEDLPRWRRGAVLPDGPAVPRAVRIIRGDAGGDARDDVARGHVRRGALPRGQALLQGPRPSGAAPAARPVRPAAAREPSRRGLPRAHGARAGRVERLARPGRFTYTASDSLTDAHQELLWTWTIGVPGSITSTQKSSTSSTSAVTPPSRSASSRGNRTGRTMSRSARPRSSIACRARESGAAACERGARDLARDPLRVARPRAPAARRVPRPAGDLHAPGGGAPLRLVRAASSR